MTEKFAENPQEEEQLQKKVGRTPEQIKELFTKNYIEKHDLDATDERVVALVNDLAEREVAHSKTVSKLIRQKVDWRTKAEEKKEVKPQENKPTNDLVGLQEIERKKAAEAVLSKIAQKHKDLGDVQGIYEKMKEEYHEKGDETLRGDFEKRFWDSFYRAYPKKYEDKIREEERKRISEDNKEPGRTSTHLKGDDKNENKRKFFIKPEPVQDWFKPKK